MVGGVWVRGKAEADGVLGLLCRPPKKDGLRENMLWLECGVESASIVPAGAGLLDRARIRGSSLPQRMAVAGRERQRMFPLWAIGQCSAMGGRVGDRSGNA